MKGLMMYCLFKIVDFIIFVVDIYLVSEIILVCIEGDIYCMIYREIVGWIVQLVYGFKVFGIEMGDWVVIFVWNGYCYFEFYYVIFGIGLVVYMINLCLLVEQLIYIINYVEDWLLFMDLIFVLIFEKFSG